MVLLRHRAKPNIFVRVLPIAFRAAPFLPFPSDPILNNEVLSRRFEYGMRRSPVAANVYRRGFLEGWYERFDSR
jgi:hypothetical protein